MAGLYRARNPRATPLYRLVAAYLATLLAVYEERFSARFGRLRPTVRRAAERYLDCGIPERGFARIRCPACHEERLLAFSCRVRALCPSCDAKRAAAWAAWVADELARPVPHRHVVFSLPRMLRPYFRNDRRLLTDLARWAWKSLHEVMAAIAPERRARPGALVVIHTSGSLADWHPHLHLLVSDGVFDEAGRFIPMPRGFLRPLEECFRARVLVTLLERGLITRERYELLRSWRHSGFSVWFESRVRANDREALERLARYMRRGPLALEHLTWCEQSSTVLYRSGKKYHPRHKANFRVFDPLDFLAESFQHIPDPYRHEVIAYGEYSNAARGKARRRTPEADDGGVPAVQGAVLWSRWRELIKRIYEVDPLACPECGTEMRWISVITDPVVVERILRHLGLWQGRAPPPSQPHGTREEESPPERELQYDPEYDQTTDEDDGNQVPPDWDEWD